MINKKNKNRNSAFELIKIIAIICIIFCHSIPAERIEYHFATTDPWLFGLIIFRQLGSIGNAVFMVSSAWFLVDNHLTDFKKIKNIIANNQIISLIFLAVLWKYVVGPKMIIKQVFPFLFSTLWYVTCYVIYYCLHEPINLAIKGIKVDSRLAATLIALINFVIFIFGGLFFTELVGFILIHVFTWYIKKKIEPFGKDKLHNAGIKVLLISIVGWILGAVILNIVGIHFEFIGTKMQNWNRFYNPFILGIAYGCMFLATTKDYKSGVINYLSSLSLYVYMITGNQLLRIYPDNIFYDIISEKYGSSMAICFLFVICYSILKFVVGVILAALYKYTLEKSISLAVNTECIMIRNALDKIFLNSE